MIHTVSGIYANTYFARIQQFQVGHIALNEGILKFVVHVGVYYVSIYLDLNMTLSFPEVHSLKVRVAWTGGMGFPVLVAPVQMVIGVDRGVVIVVGRNLPHVVAAVLAQTEYKGCISVHNSQVSLYCIMHLGRLEHIVGEVLYLAQVTPLSGDATVLPSGVVTPITVCSLKVLVVKYISRLIIGNQKVVIASRLVDVAVMVLTCTYQTVTEVTVPRVNQGKLLCIGTAKICVGMLTVIAYHNPGNKPVGVVQGNTLIAGINLAQQNTAHLPVMRTEQ